MSIGGGADPTGRRRMAAHRLPVGFQPKREGERSHNEMYYGQSAMIDRAIGIFGLGLSIISLVTSTVFPVVNKKIGVAGFAVGLS